MGNKGVVGNRTARHLAVTMVAAVGIAALVAVSITAAEPDPPQPDPPAADPLIRARNLGRAYYQNEHFAKAAELFREAVALAPDNAADRINLGVTEAQAREDLLAKESILVASTLEPAYPHVQYMMGLVHLRLGEYEEARKGYQALLEHDPLCIPAHYSLGHALDRLGNKEAAIVEWERVISLDPDHGPSYYQLFRALEQLGEKDRAKVAFEEFNRIRESGVGPGMSRTKVERSRYFGLIEEEIHPEVSDASPSRIPITLIDATSGFGLDAVEANSTPEASIALELGDMDDDGDLDLLSGFTAFMNEDGHFRATGGLASSGTDVPQAASIGDLDNDEVLDVAAAGYSLLLHRGIGDTTFEFLTQAAIPFLREETRAPRRIVDVRAVDIDHEGDLDILILLERGVRLLRNNGNSSFTDISDTTGLTVLAGSATALVLSDLECDHDIDLFLADAEGRHKLLVNERDGSFVEEAHLAGLSEAGPAAGATVGDVNNDGTPDLVLFGGKDRPVQVWLNHGDARFHRDESSPVLAKKTERANVDNGCLIDLDNDGDLDLLAAGESFLAFRNDGAGGWSDWTAALAADWMPPVAAMVNGDLDGDGDPDLLARTKDGRLIVARNDGGNVNHRVRLRLTGTKNSVDGYGSKVWTRHGRFFQMRESFARWIELGVGDRTQVEVVGLRWPTGITQNKVDVPVEELVEITERPGFSESCPFVYAYDGVRFEFITDVLDVAPLGVSLAPGVPFWPNHREAILIEEERLVAKDGLLSLKVTQELQEITFLDQLRLFVVDHPEETAVVPNDRFSGAPFAKFGIHEVEQPLPPRTATDGAGRDVLPALESADRVYADECEPVFRRYPGITHDHALILEPDHALESASLMLFLRGTMLWTEASVNVAVSQNPDVEIRPVSLDVMSPDGNWVRVRDDLGLPAGIDKFLPVDLRDAFPGPDRRVRISTNMAILWDQAFFGTVQDAPDAVAADATRAEPLVLDPLYADLHYRGFSAIVSPDGKLPDLFDYQTLMSDPIFTVVHRGHYTRYGDVAELLSATDDRFVIMAPGDEISVDFPAITLPELPVGWRRDYVLQAEGWIKDGDLRTKTGDTVAPLPFHAMTDYPFSEVAENELADDGEQQRYLADYQTRWLPRRAPSPRYP